MSKIQVLPPEVSEKIAAGEVIERPFSVVKELVENSLDAGAAEIRVELQAGGKRLVKVQDDGAGMSPEDARLCLERHATSKISNEADLERISTLGFRGEALASIAAVSDLVLRTSDGGAEAGTQVSRKGDGPAQVEVTAFPRGTSVEVRDLFFNLPARRKFLRSDQSELGLTVRYLTGAALAYPEVRFVLTHGRREIINCPAVGSLKERIFQLYGKDTLDGLMAVDFREGESGVSGFGSRPPGGRTDKARQLFFVNRRPVKDRVLQAALNQAYRGFLEKELYSEAFLFVSIPAGEVDVNVHPSKAEVRFRDSQHVFYLVLRAVEAAVLAEQGIKEIYPAREDWGGGTGISERLGRRYFPGPAGPGSQTGTLFTPGPEAREKTSHPQVLGQFLNMYIIAAGEDGLLVIDQHNAHERVLFERYKEVDAQKKWPQQSPLIPILFDLSDGQILTLENNRTLLEESGFAVEAMGGRTYVLNAFPDIFSAEEAKETLFALFEEMGQEEEAGKKREKVLATFACKSAVKAHEPLPREKMEFLVEELFRTANPAVCPHGRPIIVKIERSQIEKGLKRPPV
jgi:DNA mismatch repair protein MutL